MTDPTAQALLAAIAETDDPTSRLALADWLEEHDDPRAAWVRDAGLWAYMAPDLRDPVPGLLEDLEVTAGFPPGIDRLLRLIGPPLVPALRAWVRAEVWARFRRCRELLWDVPAPPAEDPVADAYERYLELFDKDWLTTYTAALDLRRYGALLEGYVTTRLIEVCEETWPMLDGTGWHIRDAAFAALGAIGPAAEAAVPLLLAHFTSHDAESARLADIARDALIAIRPPPEVIRGRLHYTRDEGAVQRLRAVLRALA